MKSNDKLLNYTLSVGFVVLILIFLITILQISRYALSDSSTFGSHITSTKDVLAGISEVEQKVETQSTSSYSEITITDTKTSNYEENIVDASYINVNNNQSIISIRLDSPVQELGKIYYITYKSQKEIEKLDLILYDTESEYNTGRIISIEESTNTYTVLDLSHREQVEVQYANVIGKVLFKVE